MTAAVVVLSALLLIALPGWLWAECACRAHKRKAERIEQYNNYLETRYSLTIARLRALGETDV